MIAIPERASDFLRTFQQLSPSESIKHADNLLVFLYDLSDHYRIIRSPDPRFSGMLRTVLKEFIYALESQPDGALQNQTWREFLLRLLELLATGKIIVSRSG